MYITVYGSRIFNGSYKKNKNKNIEWCTEHVQQHLKITLRMINFYTYNTLHLLIIVLGILKKLTIFRELPIWGHRTRSQCQLSQEIAHNLHVACIYSHD